MSSPQSLSSVLLFSVLVPLSAPRGQERVPVSLPSTPAAASVSSGGVEVHPRPSTQRPPTIAYPVAAGFTAVTGEGPEFAPRENVLDEAGNVVGMRLVGDPYVLSFSGGDHRPEPGLDPRLVRRAAEDPRGSAYCYVMLEGRMTSPERRGALEGLGCRILGVHTWQSFVVELPLSMIGAVEALPFVRWMGFPLTAQKLEPRLAQRMLDGDGRESLEVLLSVHASDLGPESTREQQRLAEVQVADPRNAVAATGRWIPNGPIQRALEAEGFVFSDYFEIGSVFTFRGHADAEALRRIVELDVVAFAELQLDPELHDDHSMTMIGLDRVRSDWSGAGTTVGVVDTGFQTGPNRHRDLDKFAVGWSTVTGGAFVDNDGHGTHVLGILSGTGTADQRYTGAAPGLGSVQADRLFIGRLFDNHGTPQGDFRTLFDAMSFDYVPGGAPRSQKPRVINNSWGTSTGSSGSGAQPWVGTESAPRFIDDLIYARDQLHVFSAGNTGVGVSLEATSKNALTIGSVYDYPSIPGLGTVPSSVQAGTRDNRWKPELLAPGDLITSTSNTSPTGYATRGGTSMAAPHVTGALAGLTEHFPILLRDKPHNLKAIAASTAQWLSNPGTSQGYFLGNKGMGMIQAHRMHGATDDHELFWGLSRGPMLFTGSTVFWEFQMPNDLSAARVVVAWSEQAGSAGSTLARTNDLRCYVDVEPFTGVANTGDFELQHAHNNLISLASQATTPGGFAELAAGKLVRFKVYAQSLTSLPIPGLAVCAYKEDTFAGEPVHEILASKEIVQPGEQLNVIGRLVTPAGVDEFENAQIEPRFNGVTILGMQRTTEDGLLHQYLRGDGWPSSPYPGLSTGMVLGSGTRRSLQFLLEAPAVDGVYPLSTFATARPNPADLLQTVQLCVDGSAPATITNLGSSSHTVGEWSNVTDVVLTWDPASDVGCAGLDGLASSWQQGSPVNPTVIDLGPAEVTVTRPATDSTTRNDGWFAAIRGIDLATNRGQVVTVGPFLIDTVVPTTPTVRLAGGAVATSSLTVSVEVAASDAQSGLEGLRISADGSTWGNWRPYQAGGFTADLSGFGGTTDEGTKELFVEVRDFAGNVSAAGSDTIEYERAPTLGAPSVGTAETVGRSPLVMTGTDLVGVQRVRFGNLTITSQSGEDFVDGWFTVTGDTRIEVHPPQGLAPGGYPVRVENSVATSNGRTVQLVEPSSPVLLTQQVLAPGAVQRWVTHDGGASGTIASYLVLSPLGTPSRLPGILDLALGGGFSFLFVVEPAALHDPATGAAEFAPLPIPATLAGAEWYSQAMQLDLGNLAVTPIPVTNRERTRYR